MFQPEVTQIVRFLPVPERGLRFRNLGRNPEELHQDADNSA